MFKIMQENFPDLVITNLKDANKFELMMTTSLTGSVRAFQNEKKKKEWIVEAVNSSGKEKLQFKAKY